MVNPVHQHELTSRGIRFNYAGLQRESARRRDDQVTAAKASVKRGRRGIGANVPRG